MFHEIPLEVSFFFHFGWKRCQVIEIVLKYGVFKYLGNKSKDWNCMVLNCLELRKWEPNPWEGREAFPLNPPLATAFIKVWVVLFSDSVFFCIKFKVIESVKFRPVFLNTRKNISIFEI